MAGSQQQYQQFLAMWVADSAAAGATDLLKPGYQDQEDALVKSMLSFDSDSEESHCQHTVLSSEPSVGLPDTPTKRHGVPQPILITERTESSSMNSDHSQVTCVQHALPLSLREESITGVDASCFRPGWSESVSFPDSDGDDVHQCKKQKVEWTDQLHMRFVEVVEALGVEQAPPTKILELLGAAGVGLTPQAISSHLQEYRRARSQANPAAAVPFGGPVVPTGLPAGFPLGAFPLPGAPGFPGQPPRPVGVPPMLPGGFLPPPGVGGFPLLPYALPMQGMPGQCWMPPPYNMPPGMPQAPMPQPQQWVAPRPMPMIPTPSSQFSQGPPPEVLVQRAIAEVMERPSQAVPPLGLKLDAAALVHQWNNSARGQCRA